MAAIAKLTEAREHAGEDRMVQAHAHASMLVESVILSNVKGVSQHSKPFFNEIDYETHVQSCRCLVISSFHFCLTEILPDLKATKHRCNNSSLQHGRREVYQFCCLFSQ